jgi:GTP-binding protein Era
MEHESGIDSKDASPPARSGMAAIVGRPNAGKSTLINALVREKIAIVSDKPQTTRRRISGILTRPEGQAVFVDTPGIHKPGYRLNRRMMAVTEETVASVDLILLVVDTTASAGAGDRYAIEMLKKLSTPAFLIPNKVDVLANKKGLFPLIGRYSAERQFQEVIPISALTGDGVDLLTRKIFEYLPEGPPLYPEDELTDQPQRVMAAEMVREKVVTERWEETEELIRIHCIIYVERLSERPIIIGKGGARLKEIGSAARADIEKMLGRHVYLGLFVKVHEHWRNDDRILNELGIGS